MKSFLLINLFTILLATSYQVSNAEEIAIVNIQEVIDRSVIGASAKKRLESNVKKEEVAIKQMMSELDKTKASIKSQAGLLSGKALEDRLASLNKRERDIGRAIQDKRDDLMRINRQEIAKVVTEVDKIVAELGKSRGIAVIIEDEPGFVLYKRRGLDLTDEVIEATDAKSE
jgi:Skp family chaperone for outer membrane proteins